MSDRKRNVLNTLEQMEYFNQANASLASELPVTVELFAANRTSIGKLGNLGTTAVSAGGAGVSETRSKVARAREAASDLRRTARTAKTLAKKVPGFHNTFVVPHGNLNYLQIIEFSDSFIADAQVYKTEFAIYALTSEFFSKLGETVAGLREDSQEQADAKRISVGVTAETEAVINDALEVRAELTVALRNHYRDNPQKLAEWLTASRIERRRKAPSKLPENNPPE